MLDKKTAFIMNIIIDFCNDGSYKIIEIKDILSKVTPKFASSDVSLTQTIKYLKDLEFIDIKYSDEKVYCIALLPKGRLYGEQKLLAGVSDTWKGYIKFGFILLAAFLGAFAGVLVGGLL